MADILVVGEVSGLYLVSCPYLGQVEGNVGCSYPTHPGSHRECADGCLPEKREPVIFEKGGAKHLMSVG